MPNVEKMIPTLWFGR